MSPLSSVYLSSVSLSAFATLRGKFATRQKTANFNFSLSITMVTHNTKHHVATFLLCSHSLLSTWSSFVWLSWLRGSCRSVGTRWRFRWRNTVSTHTWPFSFWNSPAVRLHASGGSANSPAVSKHTGHALADGHHLGWCEPTEGLPTQHAGPALHAGLEVGFFHQSQRHRFPN